MWYLKLLLLLWLLLLLLHLKFPELHICSHTDIEDYFYLFLIPIILFPDNRPPGWTLWLIISSVIYLSRRAWEWPWLGCRTTGPERWSTRHWAPLLQGSPSARGRKSWKRKRSREAEVTKSVQMGRKKIWHLKVWCDEHSPVRQVNPTLPPGFALGCFWRSGSIRSSLTRDSPTHPRTHPEPSESKPAKKRSQWAWAWQLW